MSHWQVKSSKEVYKTKWIRVREDELLNHNNKPMTYSVVEANQPAVYIVPLASDGKFYLLKQYIYTSDEWLWKFPAGAIDDQPLNIAAERELMEETGLKATAMRELGAIRSAVGVARVVEFIVLALDVEPVPNPAPDELEEITDIKKFSLPEIYSMIKSGELIEAPTVAALTMAVLHLGLQINED
jgi:8-oxo-dGTP pyrophosphatase MutT (NUDIX family)